MAGGDDVSDDLALRTRFGINLLALSRQGRRSIRRLRSERIQAGDVLDALVLMPEATFPGVHMIARVIGAFLLSIGERRETKLICVAVNDSSSDHLKDLGDLPSAQVDELVAFFEAYRMLEPGTIEVLERQGRDQALTMVPGSGH